MHPQGNWVNKPSQSTEVTSGTTVTLSNTASAKPIFIAPNIVSTSTLDFELTVSDTEGLVAIDSCQVTILSVFPADKGKKLSYYGIAG